MLVGVCQIELFLPDGGSLKSKRFVLSSLKTKIRQRFNVSVAEIGNQDKWQRISLGVSVISNERRLIDKTMNEIFRLIEGDGRAEILKHLLEVY